MSCDTGQKGFSFDALFGELAILADPDRERIVQECGLPYLILKCGTLGDSQGGLSSLIVSPEVSENGVVSREDVGWVVAASENMQSNTKAVVQVGNLLYAADSGRNLPHALPLLYYKQFGSL